MYTTNKIGSSIDPWVSHAIVGATGKNSLICISYDFYCFSWEVPCMGLQVPFAP